MGALEVFADVAGGSRFALYRAELGLLDKIVGGVPKDPKVIRAWLAARLEMEDRTLLEAIEEATIEMMQTQERPLTADELLDVATATVSAGNGFKTFEGQLCYEGRCLKAGLKEASNITYPGLDWPGKPAGIKKGLMRALAERVFVVEDYIPLGVTEPSGTEQRIKHNIRTAQGPRTAINVVDYVEQPKIAVTIKVLDDFLPRVVWLAIWETLEDIGIGADRARGDGKFKLLSWERIDSQPKPKPKPPRKPRTASF